MCITDLRKTLKTHKMCVSVLSPGQKQFSLCHKVAILSWVTFMLYFIVLQNIKIEIVK